MAFKRVTPELADQMAAPAAKQCGAVGSWHATAVKDLLAAAENPANADATLAAITMWRRDQEAHQLRWIKLALLLIASGDAPDMVCSGLGFGRTALQRAVRQQEQLSVFARFLYTPRPKQKSKEAA